MSHFIETIKQASNFITDGGIETRIMYGTSIQPDPHIGVASLVYDSAGKEALIDIYKSYMNIGYEFNLPLTVGVPTFRASIDRIREAGFTGKDDCKQINSACTQLLIDLRSNYQDYGKQIFIAGVIGPKNDAYKPEQALTKAAAYDYHAHQIEALAENAINFLFAPTFPAISEAIGVAKAMAKSALPYVISFVINKQGRLLDGTKIDVAIDSIDQEVSPVPLYYLINCVHASVMDSAMQHDHFLANPIRQRLFGLKANTSTKTPAQLAELNTLDTEEPKQFAEEMFALKKLYGFKILGGCCGTTEKHMAALAEKLTLVKNS